VFLYIGWRVLLGWLPAEGTGECGPMPRYLTHHHREPKVSVKPPRVHCAASLKSIATDKALDLCCHRTSHHVVTYSERCITQCPATTSSAASLHKKLQWSQPGTTEDLFPGTATTSETSQAHT